jgi:two-component system nitrate/nitrite sensor histidine kinase NarX
MNWSRILNSKLSGVGHALTDINSLLRRHRLYVRLVALLLCIVFMVVLMQAGSLYLVDYIPDNQSAIQKIYQHKLFWRHEVDTAGVTKPADAEEVMASLRNYYFRTDDPTFVWLEKKNDKTYTQALKYLKSAQADFESASMQRLPLEERVRLAKLVVLAYEPLASALQSDVEIKQSVISLLQLLSMVLLLCCVVTIALDARRVLVDRLDHLMSLASKEFAGIAHADTDEFSRLEQMMYEISARLEGFKAETEWINQTSGERIRGLIRSQDYLFKFVELINSTVLSEMTLRKLLYGLEKALNVNNAVLVFTESDTFVPAGRVLFSHHWPAAVQDELLEELTGANDVSDFVTTTVDGVKLRCLAVAFSSPSGALGVLKVEADGDRLFEESEIRLVEMTAQLLSMVMGSQGREQEGRRVALLEERSAIARELHDSLAQSLSFMKIQIARLQSNVGAEGVPEAAIHGIVNELREGLDNAYRELRELLATFRVHMDVRGLGYSIQSAIDEFTQRSSLSITFDNRLVNCRLTVNEEFHILHVVREALSNIVRHSGAKNVTIAMSSQTNGTIMVTIDDDGVGYTFKSDEPHHYGQTIMKERASSLGGEVEVLRRRKGGTRVRLVFNPKLAQ